MQLAREAAEHGMRSVNQTVEAMETINQAVAATTGQIEELNASGKEIGAFTQTISEIADQTKAFRIRHSRWRGSSTSMAA